MDWCDVGDWVHENLVSGMELASLVNLQHMFLDFFYAMKGTEQELIA